MANRGWIKPGWRNIPVFGKATVLPSEDYNDVSRLRDWADTTAKTFAWVNDGGGFEGFRARDESQTKKTAQRIVDAIDASRQKYTRGSEYGYSKELWGMLVVIALDKTDINDLMDDIEMYVLALYRENESKTKLRRGVVRTAKQQKMINDIIKAIALVSIDIDTEVQNIVRKYSHET